MAKMTILRWEVLGFLFIVIIGTALHFCYEWSGNFVPLALFCAVNESVWEHLKLGFWPGFFFALLEYIVWGKNRNNFLTAKALSLFIMPALIVALFYAYTAVLGTHLLAVDILIFIVSVLFAQFISYQIIVSDRDYSSLDRPALVLLAAMVLAFSLFTYFPPKLQLFLDPKTGKPGIGTY